MKNKQWVLLAITAIFALAFIGCNGDGDETYTVTFDSDGGTAVSAQTVTEGGKAVEPKPNPTKSGFDFVHWFNTADNAEWNFNTAVTANLTLKAKWESLLCTCPEIILIGESCCENSGVIDCNCNPVAGQRLTEYNNIPVTNREGNVVDFDAAFTNVKNAFAEMEEFTPQEALVIRNNVKEVRIVPTSGEVSNVLDNGKYIVTIKENYTVTDIAWGTLYFLAEEIIEANEE